MAAIVLTMWTLLVLPFRAAFYWGYYRELEMHHNVIQQLEARAAACLFVPHHKHEAHLFRELKCLELLFCCFNLT